METEKHSFAVAAPSRGLTPFWLSHRCLPLRVCFPFLSCLFARVFRFLPLLLSPNKDRRRCVSAGRLRFPGVRVRREGYRLGRGEGKMRTLQYWYTCPEVDTGGLCVFCIIHVSIKYRNLFLRVVFHPKQTSKQANHGVRCKLRGSSVPVLPIQLQRQQHRD